MAENLERSQITKAKGTTEDEMPGWHHRLNGRESESRSVVSDTLQPHGLYSHEFGQIPGDGKGQGSLKCCNPWSRRESDTT